MKISLEDRKKESQKKLEKWKSVYELSKHELNARKDLKTLIDSFEWEELEEIEHSWLEEYKKNIENIDANYTKLKTAGEASSEEKETFEKKQEESSAKLKDELDGIFEKYHYIGLHAEHERLLANLYTLFGKIFPDDELWPFMIEEERKHESWLKEIMLKLKEGVINFRNPDYSIDLVKKEIINLSETIEYCSAYKITHQEAYQIAFHQENSMLEDKFFDNFSSDAPAIESVFEKLIEDTLEHRRWLNRRMEFYNY